VQVEGEELGTETKRAGKRGRSRLKRGRVMRTPKGS